MDTPRARLQISRPLDRWLLTYSDMMTLLIAFFVLVYAMSAVSRGKFDQLATSVRNGFGGPTEGSTHILPGGGAHVQHPGITPDMRIDSTQAYGQAMRNLRLFVEQHRMGGRVGVRLGGRGTVLSLVSDGMLFGRGQAALSAESGRLLDRIADVIRATPNDVEIEGHTCNLPVHGAQYPSNWELSTARAAAVLRYFTERLDMPASRFSASGYADTRPLKPNDSEANRMRNRRVDIVLVKSRAEEIADALRETELRRVLAPGAAREAPATDARAALR
jgi:chemotaxis protein MotB